MILAPGACLVFWGPSASVPGGGPPSGDFAIESGVGMGNGYRLHFIDTDTILIHTVIHTILYNLVQK